MRRKILFFMILLPLSLSAKPAELIEIQNMALSENPRIMAMEAEAQMMKKRIPQSTALDDPNVKLGINNLTVKDPSFTKEDMTSVEIGVSQMIPLGKLPYQKKIALKEYDKAMLKLRAMKVETLHMLRMNYYELMYALISIDILEKIKKQLQLVVDSEIAATKSGMGSLANVIKAKTEYNMIDEEIIALKQKKEEFGQNINYLTGTTVTVRQATMQEPDFKEMPADVIQKELLVSNPELKLFSLDVEISRDEVALKESEYAPNLELGFSYMARQDGTNPDGSRMKRDDMVTVMTTFSIPFWFWNKNMPMVDEMKKKNESTKNLYRDTLNRMNARAVILVSQMVKWRELSALYREKLIPQTELALETNLGRYRTSTVEFMPVIDTVRMLLRYKKDLAMAVKEYYASYSELNALVGVEVLP